MKSRIQFRPLPLFESESVAPPAVPARLAGARDRAHWHEGALSGWWHDGAAWGQARDGRWVWLERSGERWWAYADPKAAPALLHEGRWWLRADGLWFLVHDGQPWGYRYFARWQQEGFQSDDGMQLLYSADGSRLAVVVPGEGAAAYDAQTGEELGRWTEAELPKRGLPRAPGGLILPR